jgi:hypothetical protein
MRKRLFLTLFWVWICSLACYANDEGQPKRYFSVGIGFPYFQYNITHSWYVPSMVDLSYSNHKSTLGFYTTLDVPKDVNPGSFVMYYDRSFWWNRFSFLVGIQAGVLSGAGWDGSKIIYYGMGPTVGVGVKFLKTNTFKIEYGLRIGPAYLESIKEWNLGFSLPAIKLTVAHNFALHE